MKDFLNLQGEQYDLIRNHIDSMGTIHKRGYKETHKRFTTKLMFKYLIRNLVLIFLPTLMH